MMMGATENINIDTAIYILKQVLVFVIITLGFRLLWKELQGKPARFRDGTLKIDNVIVFGLRPTGILYSLARIQDKHPNICKLWFCLKPVYLISKPEYFKIILTSPRALSKIYLYRFISEVFYSGLFVAPVPLWKRHRKIINPTFNKKIIDSFVDIFYQQAEILNDDISKHVGENNCDVKHLLLPCLMKSSMKTIFGMDANANIELLEYVERITEVVACRTINPLYHPYITFRLSSLYKDLQYFVQKALRLSDTLLVKKLTEFEKEAKDSENVVHGDDELIRRPFLDHVLTNSDFTLEEVKEEFCMFVMAVLDTSFISMQCLLIVLGIHQDIQDKIYKEIMDLVGPERPIAQEDLLKLEYLERVIKETLRMFPAGPLIGRDLTEDLDLGDVYLRKGSTLIINLFHTHRDPNIWEDPLRFDPDRFLPENVSKRHTCAYIPFSYGPRNCIGKEYGMASMKTIIATLVRKFRIQSEYKDISEIRLRFNLTLRLTDDPRVSFEFRT